MESCDKPGEDATIPVVRNCINAATVARKNWGTVVYGVPRGRLDVGWTDAPELFPLSDKEYLLTYPFYSEEQNEFENAS